MTDTLDDYLSKHPSDEIREILQEYTDELLTKMEMNDLL